MPQILAAIGPLLGAGSAAVPTTVGATGLTGATLGIPTGVGAGATTGLLGAGGAFGGGGLLPQFGQGLGQGLFGTPKQPSNAFNFGTMAGQSLLQPKPDASPEAAAGGQFLEQQLQRKIRQLQQMGIL